MNFATGTVEQSDSRAPPDRCHNSTVPILAPQPAWETSRVVPSNQRSRAADRPRDRSAPRSDKVRRRPCRSPAGAAPRRIPRLGTARLLSTSVVSGRPRHADIPTRFHDPHGKTSRPRMANGACAAQIPNRPPHPANMPHAGPSAPRILSRGSQYRRPWPAADRSCLARGSMNVPFGHTSRYPPAPNPCP